MPIEYRMDRDRRFVSARGFGTLTTDDVSRYQREVWSLPEFRGCNELLDLSDVERIVPPTSDDIRQLARYAASMDEATAATRLAIVAPNDLAYGLGRMYEAYRGSDPRSIKEVRVFRSVRDAMEWLWRK